MISDFVGSTAPVEDRHGQDRNVAKPTQPPRGQRQCRRVRTRAVHEKRQSPAPGRGGRLESVVVSSVAGAAAMLDARGVRP